MLIEPRFSDVSFSGDLELLKKALEKAAAEVKANGGIPVVLWKTDKTQNGVSQKILEVMQTPPWNFARDYEPAKVVWLVVCLPEFRICEDMLRQFNSTFVLASLDAGIGAVAIQFQSELTGYEWSTVNNWLNSISATLALFKNGASSMRETSSGYSFWFRSLKNDC